MTTIANEECAAIGGQAAALEFAVKLLIITHPDKARLRKIWDELLVERIDAWMEQPAYQNAAVRDEMHKQLADMRQMLDAAAAIDAKED